MSNFKLNVKKSPVDERDFVAETIHAPLMASPLPEVVDHRKDLMPIRNQGAQGTCAAQTSACMKEWQERQEHNFDEYMSPQFIYNNRANKDSEGMFSRDVMKILSKVGSVPEKLYPYNSSEPFTDNLKELAINYRIKSYASINSINSLKQALAINGPCYIAVPCYNYGPRMWKPNQKDTQIGGHAMTCVGYNKEGFIIRNSWGSSWCDNGYTIFPYEDWGLQWEVWTTIDENSGKPYVPTKDNVGFFTRFINFFKKLFS